LMALRTLLAHPAQCKSTLSTMGCGPAAALPPSFFFSPPASLSAAFFPFPMEAACLVEWSGVEWMERRPVSRCVGRVGFAKRTAGVGRR
jgi:hypothetical protein